MFCLFNIIIIKSLCYMTNKWIYHKIEMRKQIPLTDTSVGMKNDWGECCKVTMNNCSLGGAAGWFLTVCCCDYWPKLHWLTLHWTSPSNELQSEWNKISNQWASWNLQASMWHARKLVPCPFLLCWTWWHVIAWLFLQWMILNIIYGIKVTINNQSVIHPPPEKMPGYFFF